ncbi:CynX/NimT family MFS transporter [Saccharibacillus kuerlensis]|uniref:MFS transporter n=1 Tax=Saccharibacillus kuerlensis TaxID=459527 RepID=A0ABQ2L4P0_9BACL|nr:MFS transporter [Saccharibacillus kuerlensis]GGO03073.1 MFS transporter [Saccharibacillus kuerlensis]
MKRTDLPRTEDASNAVYYMLLAGILLVAANLRTHITSLSPIIDTIREALSLSNTTAGFLTTLPLLAFALLSPFVSKWARTYGAERMIFISLVLIVVGSLFRPFGGIVPLMAGTFLIGLAVAVFNVLLPSIIKREFPQKIGVMTGLYSIMMGIFASAAAAVSVPISGTGIGWRGALLIWTILSAIGLIVWLPQLRRNTRGASANAPDVPKRSIWRSPLAWFITVNMGMQSSIYYIMVAWLPNMMQAQHLDPVVAGYMLSLFQMLMIPVNFIAPILAARMRDQRSLIVMTSISYVLGIFGFLFAGGSLIIIVLAIVFFSLGGGFSFSLIMMFFSLRTKNASEAADISGMAQSVGYLLAGCGPLLFGALHDATGGWEIPYYVMFGITAAYLLTGLYAGRGGRYVHD